MVMLCLPRGAQCSEWFCDLSIRHPLTNAELLAGSPYRNEENLVVFAFSQQVHMLNAMREQRAHSIMSQRAKQCLDGLLMWNYLNHVAGEGGHSWCALSTFRRWPGLASLMLAVPSSSELTPQANRFKCL